jgi:hypothetical protein
VRTVSHGGRWVGDLASDIFDPIIWEPNHMPRSRA